MDRHVSIVDVLNVGHREILLTIGLLWFGQVVAVVRVRVAPAVTGRWVSEALASEDARGMVVSVA